MISSMETKKKTKILNAEQTPQAPLFVTVFVLIQCAILFLFGYFRDFLRNAGLERNKYGGEHPRMKVSYLHPIQRETY